MASLTRRKSIVKVYNNYLNGEEKQGKSHKHAPCGNRACDGCCGGQKMLTKGYSQYFPVSYDQPDHSNANTTTTQHYPDARFKNKSYAHGLNRIYLIEPNIKKTPSTPRVANGVAKQRTYRLQVPIPLYWELKPYEIHLKELNLVELEDERTYEFCKIRDNFMATFMFHKPTFFKVQRVENYKLYSQYYSKKKELSSNHLIPKDGNEVMLYHGTKWENVDDICAKGFSVDCCKPDSRVLGKGIYFSSQSSSSHFYTDFEPGYLKFMFVARVLLGKYVQGYTWCYEERPRIDGTDMFYDSAKDSNHQTYCVFESRQAYPEYLITYH